MKNNQAAPSKKAGQKVQFKPIDGNQIAQALTHLHRAQEAFRGLNHLLQHAQNAGSIEGAEERIVGLDKQLEEAVQGYRTALEPKEAEVVEEPKKEEEGETLKLESSTPPPPPPPAPPAKPADEKKSEEKSEKPETKSK